MSLASEPHERHERHASGPRTRSAPWTVAALAAVLITTQAGTVRAASVARQFTAERSPVAVEVTVAGRSTPLFMAANRPDRWYLEAKKGQKYEIRVRNTTGDRIGFVLAVDGLNAIDGKLSRNAPNEAMYVLEPYASSTIKGWRRSLDHVSRFVFVDEERSYAERTGQANGDLGWIRVTAFHEVWYAGGWGQVMPEYRRERDGDAPRAPAKEQAAPPSAAPETHRKDGNGMDIQGSRDPVAESNPGTGWGPNERDRVRRVEFQPRAYASAQVILRYEYRPALVALGILPWGRDRDRTWERDRGWYGFAQPPRDGR